MKTFPLAVAFLFTSLCCAGCGDCRPPGTAGNDSTLVGGPCAVNEDCDQRLCQTTSRFPEGICTLSCGSACQCPEGSSCAQLDTGWVCLVSCQDTADCRTGYACESVTEAGTNEGSSVSVCIGPES